MHKSILVCFLYPTVYNKNAVNVLCLCRVQESFGTWLTLTSCARWVRQGAVETRSQHASCVTSTIWRSRSSRMPARPRYFPPSSAGGCVSISLLPLPKEGSSSSYLFSENDTKNIINHKQINTIGRLPEMLKTHWLAACVIIECSVLRSSLIWHWPSDHLFLYSLFVQITSRIWCRGRTRSCWRALMCTTPSRRSCCRHLPRATTRSTCETSAKSSKAFSWLTLPSWRLASFWFSPCTTFFGW